MSGAREKAKRYRDRAAGLRTIAASLPADNKQRMLIRIAMEYERLAQLYETGDPEDNRLDAIAALKPDNPD
jgi:hypothetical protein